MSVLWGLHLIATVSAALSGCMAEALGSSLLMSALSSLGVLLRRASPEESTP